MADRSQTTPVMNSPVLRNIRSLKGIFTFVASIYIIFFPNDRLLAEKPSRYIGQLRGAGCSGAEVSGLLEEECLVAPGMVVMFNLKAL